MTKLFQLFFCLFLLAPTIVSAEIIDRVVAVVNEDLITLSELNNEGELHMEKIREQVPIEQRAEAMAQLRQQILTSMIDRLLIEQRAEKRGIQVSNEEAEMQYFQILEQNNVEEKDFVEKLRQAGLTPEMYKRNLKSQITRQRLLNREINSKIVISNTQIELYYLQEYGQESSEDGLHILQIGCLAGSGEDLNSKPDAQRRVKQLRGMVMAGENFQDIAKNYSELPSASDGGDIGVFKEKELSREMIEGIAGLHPGEISNIIETRSGYQFLKILSSKSGNTITQAPLELVRDDIIALLREKELKEKFDQWVIQLREHSYIKEQL
ncbi:MAG: SurA N-terminal domain-containing protein [Desulfobulbaceae bacterium]|jgi:peptidyl-prolyl cis-trans isomerase SurA|nr:SurA N-terminal domain-containing protein [Desulfobulbaceae bacterium]